MGFFKRGQQAAQQASVAAQQTAHALPTRASLFQESWRCEFLVQAAQGGLGPKVTAALLRTLDTVRSVVEFEDQLDAAVAFTLDRTLKDYIPELVKRYQRVVATGAIPDRPRLEESALTLLQANLDLFETVKQHNMIALESQSLFLENKFGGSSLA